MRSSSVSIDFYLSPILRDKIYSDFIKEYNRNREQSTPYSKSNHFQFEYSDFEWISDVKWTSNIF